MYPGTVNKSATVENRMLIVRSTLVHASNKSTACKPSTKAAERKLPACKECFIAGLFVGSGNNIGFPGGNIGSLIVGVADGLHGSLILTVSFLRLLRFESSPSSSGARAIAMEIGGRGGGFAPEDWVFGIAWSSFMGSWLPIHRNELLDHSNLEIGVLTPSSKPSRDVHIPIAPQACAPFVIPKIVPPAIASDPVRK
jgi:hypothetical protein